MNPGIFGASVMQQDIFKIIAMINQDNFAVILNMLEHVTILFQPEPNMISSISFRILSGVVVPEEL